MNYNILSQDIYTTKRSIVHFSSKLGKGLQKPNRDFLMDMLFGLAKGKSVILSDIAKTLEEPIDTIQMVKRLSTRLEDFHEDDALMTNYGELLSSYVHKEDNLIIVDNSEIIKSYSKKLEGLGKSQRWEYKQNRKGLLDS